ncbi:MAG: hypothetical protein A3E61_02030 [Candidatus Colwellbacteria bacterium RIFCSPHIGHO2_12_FULL_43_12]|uniref:Cohesin domain-containing protein n=1 Tax=Candidatus Colwellbacteria bacterium RIFCSPHIGHO2_12_FULL_43_12 TaxID=1797688 RepID=A0A1G1Z305_9BACT|nr:MAG: hypothetical protein A3E61_02030 [Candidatus Colwellbacteria bacterium RIFCSPHIGHO2_12_FULL_43_12]
MNSKLKIKRYLIATFMIFALLPSATLAAEINIDTKNPELKTGEQFTTAIFLSTDEGINALEGQIVFPPDLLELKEVQDGDSIINFWLEKPRIDSPGKIIFSGITPGGFQGNSGLLFSMTFQTKQSGNGTITSQNVKALKNDGVGTPIEITLPNFQFSISKEVAVVIPAQKEDYEPPEMFLPEVTHDKNIFDDKWFLVFATQDKDSGIDHYEVKESRQRLFSVFDKWVSAESPHIISDQELRSYVFIKAIDKAGNARVFKVNPKSPLMWYENYENWTIIIVGAFAVLFVTKKLWRKKRT